MHGVVHVPLFLIWDGIIEVNDRIQFDGASGQNISRVEVKIRTNIHEDIQRHIRSSMLDIFIMGLGNIKDFSGFFLCEIQSFPLLADS